jgi:hypothetical protein
VSEQAKHLEAIWIERERKQRRQIDPADPTATIGTAASEATKECRLDLQHEFRLVSIRDRLGPGPMTDAEAESARLKKEAADKLEAERKAKEAQAEKERIAAERKAAAAADKVKLSAFADMLRGIVCPGVVSDGANKITDVATMKIRDLAEWIDSQSEAL